MKSFLLAVEVAGTHRIDLATLANALNLNSFNFCLSNTCAKRISKHIVNVVVRNLCTAALVEGSGFKVLMNYMESGYHVPTSTHIAEVVKQKFVKGKDNIK